MYDSESALSSTESLSRPHEDNKETSFSNNSSDEMEVLGSIQPYTDEPLAHSSDEEDDAEEDEDGLTPAILRARFDSEVPLNEWCTCGECAIENLTDAIEFQCCKENGNAVHKLMFDGSIERIKCITKHEDFSAITNRSVLLQVGPLLREQSGRAYRRSSGKTENQYLRAVSYRWLVRWICGYLGWENTRPLPACVYQNKRLKFPSSTTKGYQSAAQRN